MNSKQDGNARVIVGVALLRSVLGTANTLPFRQTVTQPSVRVDVVGRPQASACETASTAGNRQPSTAHPVYNNRTRRVARDANGNRPVSRSAAFLFTRRTALRPTATAPQQSVTLEHCGAPNNGLGPRTAIRIPRPCLSSGVTSRPETTTSQRRVDRRATSVPPCIAVCRHGRARRPFRSAGV